MNNLLYVVLALCMLHLSSAHSADGFDPTEQAMLTWIDQNSDEAIDLIEELVNINSGTMNFEGVKRVGSLLRAEFDKVGLETRWIEMPKEVNRAGHLFVRQDGSRGKKILLIGHLDTVFPKDDPFQTYVRDGDIAKGPGVDDMKGGNVIILYALKALAAARVLEGVQLVVALSGDEENPGSPLNIARRDMIAAGKWADVALGFESAMTLDGKDWASTARRGFSSWQLTVKGQQAHSSLIFSEAVGAGAAFETARILNAFYEKVRGEQYLTFNAGNILVGTDLNYDDASTSGTVSGKTNVVPGRAVVNGGIRTLTADQLQKAKDSMQAVVVSHLPQTQAELVFTDHYPPMAPTPGNKQLRKMLSDINQQLGRGAMPELDPMLRGAADISFVAPYTDALAGLGTIGSGDHSPKEQMHLNEMPLVIKRAALMIYRLSQ